MPTYEYHCEKCKKDFELFQSMKDEPVAVCPKEKCRRKTWGKGKVRRLLGTGAGLIFKGSGFYITDYRSEGYKEAAKSEASAGAPPKAAESKHDASAKPDAAAKPEKPAAPKAAPAAGEPRKSRKKE
jgi:putative FmdB family regulatory protein